MQETIAEVGATSRAQMGAVMKALGPKVAGRDLNGVNQIIPVTVNVIAAGQGEGEAGGEGEAPFEDAGYEVVADLALQDIDSWLSEPEAKSIESRSKRIFQNAHGPKCLSTGALGPRQTWNTPVRNGSSEANRVTIWSDSMSTFRVAAGSMIASTQPRAAP